MNTITIEQHTALLAAFDALLEKHLAAAVRRDLQSTEYLNKQYDVIRDLIDNATIEVEDAPTPDAPPLWRDSDREDWMLDGEIHLELVAAPYMAVAINPALSRLTFVMVQDADEIVAVSPEHLPALIAMLQEVQRRIGGDVK